MTPCTGCGECCLGLPCLDSVQTHSKAFLDGKECPELLWVGEHDRFYCRAMLDTGKAAWIMRKHHSVGWGCTFKQTHKE